MSFLLKSVLSKEALAEDGSWETPAAVSPQMSTITRISTNQNSSMRGLESTLESSATRWNRKPEKHHTKREGK